MSMWECPICEAEYDYASNPDTARDLSPCGKTNFECNCGCRFEMWVDFEPVFTIDKSSVKLPEPKP